MLKWGAAYGMTVNWNILAGFPGETSADYREQAELIPLLVHLQPPLGAHRIWLERFSPNFFETDRGFNDIKPLECYRFAYPVPGIDLSQIAYFYDYKAENTVSDQDLKLLQDAVGAWQELWRGRRTPLLRYFSGPGWIRVVDSRSGKARKVMLTGDEVKVFKAVEDTERSVSAVSRELGLSETRVQAILGELVEGGLALEEDGHYLGLAMPLERHLNRGLDGRRGPRSESPSSARRDLPMVIRDTEGAPAR
jgi:hypothetical protein